MERMKHTGDYELDKINMLEQECADLEEENKNLTKCNLNLQKHIDKVEEENKKLKAELELKNLALEQAQEGSILI